MAGAGPVGLYFSYLLKRQHPRCEIGVFEQNPPLMAFFRSFEVRGLERSDQGRIRCPFYALHITHYDSYRFELC